jgi:hypothetical protein
VEKIVAFSCKGRMCPSCWARRTADTAAHLVERVFPEARYRQWVLTFPWELRYHLATDRAFNSAALRVFMRTLASWLRLRGRRLGLRDGRTGAVACLQRFGGILNLNPHIHALLPDGLFVPGPSPDANTAPTDPGVNCGLVFVPLPPPTDTEFADLAVKLAARLGALARRRFQQAEDELHLLDADTLPLRTSAAESVRPPGQRARTPDEARESRLTVLPDKPLCSRIHGFSLHAARIVEPDDRTGLERLARYCLRAPYSLDRLSLTADGMVRYKLYRPWPTPTGRTEILLEPLAFMRRLAALLPGPYVNMIRYYGVFASRAKCRDLLPLPPVKIDAATTDVSPDPSATPAPAPANAAAAATGAPDTGTGKDPTATTSTPATRCRRPRYLSWACLLKRVLDVAALSCPRCHGPMVVLAFLSDPVVVEKILKHLELPTTPPPLGPDRSAVEECDPCMDACVSGDDPTDGQGPPSDPARRPRAARPPPLNLAVDAPAPHVPVQPRPAGPPPGGAWPHTSQPHTASDTLRWGAPPRGAFTPTPFFRARTDRPASANPRFPIGRPPTPPRLTLYLALRCVSWVILPIHRLCL